ncbi:MAG TPA: chloride channel protein [Stellaceae bacterium]|nr:chloride channel protein [Stellaceae bacterium]
MKAGAPASKSETAGAALHAAGQEDRDSQPIGLVILSILAFGVGIATGLGAVFFRYLIGLLHNLAFLGLAHFRYDANLFTPPSPWGAAIILVPVGGAVIVTFLVNFAPETRGHGAPEVMDAIYYNAGRIRPVVAVIKSVASAVAIGTGATVGREGPMIQIGAAVGSTLGQIIRMTPGQRITLVAAGAGGGIASAFNTPIGGVLFAIELMMPEVGVSTFLPVAIATGTATFVDRLFFGSAPAFIVPAIAPLPADAEAALTLVLYGLLGVVAGLAATAFIRVLDFFEDAFERLHNTYARHLLGMLLVGIIIYLVFHFFGHYYVQGVGYSTIQSIMFQRTTLPWFLLLLFLAELAATALCLGSGSSGGIFSPSLYMGATIGGAFAGLLLLIPLLPAHIDIRSFALVGMGATVGGATGAVMTAVAMIFEMTRDYDIVLPMIIAVAFAVGVRRMLSRESIYTIKLFRRGHVVPKALHANMFLVRRASDVMATDFALVPAQTSFDAFLGSPDNQGRMRYVLVTSGDRIIGTQRINTSLHHGLEGAATGATMGEVANRNFVIAREGDIVFDVIRRMWRRGAFMAVVVGKSGIPRARDAKGVISKEHVADSVAASIQIYAG